MRDVYILIYCMYISPLTAFHLGNFEYLISSCEKVALLESVALKALSVII